MTEKELLLYHFEPKIATLGPGNRSGIWFQGCERDCPGCLAPESHRRDSGNLWAVDTLVDAIVGQTGVEGISISGGEPFLQQEGLLSLLQTMKQRRPALSVMLYTGFLLTELQTAREREIVQYVDILVDGPFRIEEQVDDPWRGSGNQKIHFLSTRYNSALHEQAASGVEFFVRAGGEIFLSGVPPRGLLEKLETSMANNFALQNI